MALQTTYDLVGIKEDVSDVISNIAPTKTPFQTSLTNEGADNTVFQWQEDDLAAVGANAQIDGFTAQAPQVAALGTPGTYVGTLAATATVMRSNFTQILSKTIRVSGTADRVRKYGRERELAYQLAKRSAELKRDLEHAYVGLAQTATAGNASTARLMASATTMIDASVRVVNGASTALTEAMILQANQNLFSAGSEASIIMVKPADSLRVANFAYVAPLAGLANQPGQRLRDAGDSTTIVNTVDVYRSPFGTQRVVLNRFINATHCIVYDPEMWRKVTLRPWFRETLGKNGDNTAVMLVGEYSLKHRNFRASSFINNLN
jgi:hypothetical protein